MANGLKWKLVCDFETRMIAVSDGISSSRNSKVAVRAREIHYSEHGVHNEMRENVLDDEKTLAAAGWATDGAVKRLFVAGNGL